MVSARISTEAEINLQAPGMVTPEQPWQALLDSAGEGIWGVDLQGRCTFVNRAALQMLGFQSDELVGGNMHEIVHHHYPDGRVYPREECVVYNVFWKNQPFTNRVDHIFRKDGSLFFAEMSAQPIIFRGEVRGAVVTFRDITHARMAEDALRRSEKLAAVGQLASSIAHEINNPLEAVTNLLYLMRTADTLSEVKTYASLAESELARVSDIALQTLRFHRQPKAAVPVDLHETLPAVLRLYSSRFASRKVEIKIRLRKTPPALVLEGDIRQVLNNLIRNAYDAMPRGGRLHLRLRPATCMLTGRPGVRISVADTGTGFLPRMRKHLFEPFHTSKEATGTGLGLWITKGIIDRHSGRMQMRSRMEEDAERTYGVSTSVTKTPARRKGDIVEHDAVSNLPHGAALERIAATSEESASAELPCLAAPVHVRNGQPHQSASKHGTVFSLWLPLHAELPASA